MICTMYAGAAINGISPAKPKPRAGGGACRRPVIAEIIEGVASWEAEVDNVPLDCSGVSSPLVVHCAPWLLPCADEIFLDSCGLLRGDVSS